MQLIVFLGLVANLALVCGGCNIGSQSVKNNFDWNKVCVIEEKIFLKN
jgi:hypothetical protein